MTRFDLSGWLLILGFIIFALRGEARGHERTRTA